MTEPNERVPEERIPEGAVSYSIGWSFDGSGQTADLDGAEPLEVALTLEDYYEMASDEAAERTSSFVVFFDGEGNELWP